MPLVSRVPTSAAIGMPPEERVEVRAAGASRVSRDEGFAAFRATHQGDLLRTRRAVRGCAPGGRARAAGPGADVRGVSPGQQRGPARLRPARALVHAIRVTVDGAEPTATLVVAWGDDQQAPTGERPRPASDGTMFRAEDTAGTASSRIMAGVVPSWLPDAHVVLFSAEGMTDPSGDLVHAVEVPTFADPAGSGARLYVVVTDPRVPLGHRPVRGIVYAAPDGTFLDAEGECALVPELCTGVRSDGLDLRSELLSAIER